MKRRVVSFMLALALLVLPVAAFAQNNLTSGFQIQNLSGSTASVSVQFVRQDGTTATTQSGTIAANQSVTFFPLGAPPAGFTGADVPAGFNGSVVISSDQPVAAISNILRNDFAAGGSYNGFSSGDTNVTLAVIQKNNSGFNTYFNVQNLGSAAATVNIQFVHGLAGSDATQGPTTIQAGAAATFTQADNASLGTTFVGIAKVTSDQPVAVTVNQEGGPLFLTYDGAATSNASSSALLPLIMANNSGFFTGIGVTNVGAAATDITITYSPNTASTGTPCPTPTPTSFTAVPANSGVFALQNASDPQFATCSYVGSATVTSSGQNVVAVVNQLGAGYASSYEGFSPADATATVKLPLIMANNSGYFTGIQVQNADAAASAAVSVTFGPNSVTGTGACGALTPVTATIGAGQSLTTLQNASNPDFATCTYIGSATVTGPAGAKLFAIVNELGASGGDQLLTYSGFNQ